MIAAPITSAGASRFLRPLASLLAAALALTSTAILYLVAGVPEVENFTHVRFVLGPDGFMQGSLAILLGWAAGPAAAAACAWALAFRAARRERWTGSWMGLVTYSLTLLLASFVPDLSRAINNQTPWGQSMLEGIVGAPVMAIFAGAVLGPLLVVCVLAGCFWAWIVRQTASLPPQAPTKPSLFDYTGLTVGIVVLLSLLSSLVATLLANAIATGLPSGLD